MSLELEVDRQAGARLQPFGDAHVQEAQSRGVGREESVEALILEEAANVDVAPIRPGERRANLENAIGEVVERGLRRAAGVLQVELLGHGEVGGAGARCQSIQWPALSQPCQPQPLTQLIEGVSVGASKLPSQSHDGEMAGFAG